MSIIKMSKLQLFLKLGNYNNISKTSRIVFTTEFVNEFAGLRLGNGGSWCRYSNANKYKIVTMKNNGKFNFLWNVTEDEKLTIKREFAHIKTSKGKQLLLHYYRLLQNYLKIYIYIPLNNE